MIPDEDSSCKTVTASRSKLPLGRKEIQQSIRS
jgi:hypothetical protein